MTTWQQQRDAERARREAAKIEHPAWFERTGHCGGCGNPGNYCTCTTANPCGCRALHPMSSANREDALAQFSDAPPSIISDEQEALFG